VATESNPYRDLPAVDELINTIDSGDIPRRFLAEVARTAVGLARDSIKAGGDGDAESIATALLQEARLRRTQRVINATGVLLHTNLGRAPLSYAAGEAARTAAVSFVNAEIDLVTGFRGGRGSGAVSLLKSLTGADDALVVNNNAAALMLALAATATGKGVPVSRGELIEIGGSYRLPEVMRMSGADLIEVGTTNRSRSGDFVTALQIHDCGAVLKVHPSNYRVEGFTEEPDIEELAVVAHDRGVPLIHDVGSGFLDRNAGWLGSTPPEWLRDEPAVRQSLEQGADLVMFSSDKLLGGPQAGVIVGRKEFVSALRRNPLARTMRTSVMTDAALEVTLEAYLDDRVTDIPFWRMAMLSEENLAPRIDRVSRALGGKITQGKSLIGAGSVPGTGIPTKQIALVDEDHLYEPLLRVPTPVATRRADGNLIIDLRAVDLYDDNVVIDMVNRCR
jgi:L-seryl-tRNA(Ser) seleniumtransferase